MSENTEIAFEQSDLAMTLILGARCTDGVVLAADTRFKINYDAGTQYRYGHKIKGELDGISTGFSGDRGVFEIFTMTLKDYVTFTINANREKFLNQHLIGLRNEPMYGPSFEKVKLKISRIQNDFYHKYDRYRYRVLMGVSSMHSPQQNQSTLYYFEEDGRCIPSSEPMAIGSGAPYTTYFLKYYWRQNETTMEQFAQLGDLIIRYVCDPTCRLDDAVGLNDSPDQYQYPQIVYIPDNPNFCQIYNNDQPKVDCFPHITRLNEFHHNSENFLNTLHRLLPP